MINRSGVGNDQAVSDADEDDESFDLGDLFTLDGIRRSLPIIMLTVAIFVFGVAVGAYLTYGQAVLWANQQIINKSMACLNDSMTFDQPAQPEIKGYFDRWNITINTTNITS